MNKSTYAILVVLFVGMGISCSSDTDERDSATQQAEASEPDLGSDASIDQEDQDDEDVNCYELSPEECEPYSMDNAFGPCAFLSLAPYNTKEKCYETRRRVCMFIGDRGDNAESMAIDPDGQCYVNNSYDNLPPGWTFIGGLGGGCECVEDGSYMQNCDAGPLNSCE